MKKVVFAVNSGSYSDYRIDAIFSTKDKAEAYMKAVSGDDYNAIEEYEMDPPVTDLIKRGYSIWMVHMLVDGTTERVEQRELDSYAVSSIGHTVWRRTQAAAFKGTGKPDILISIVWAKNSEQAIKIVNEHRIQMIANNQWH